MDAISFVLGVKTRDLRGNQLKVSALRPPSAFFCQPTLRARGCAISLTEGSPVVAMPMRGEHTQGWAATPRHQTRSQSLHPADPSRSQWCTLPGTPRPFAAAP